MSNAICSSRESNPSRGIGNLFELRLFRIAVIRVRHSGHTFAFYRLTEHGNKCGSKGSVMLIFYFFVILAGYAKGYDEPALAIFLLSI